MASGKGGSAPQAVDPYQAADAQYEYGALGANYNTALQRPNISTPYGSVNWSTAGSPNPNNNYMPAIPGYTAAPYSPSMGFGGPSPGAPTGPGASIVYQPGNPQQPAGPGAQPVYTSQFGSQPFQTSPAPSSSSPAPAPTTTVPRPVSPGIVGTAASNGRPTPAEQLIGAFGKNPAGQSVPPATYSTTGGPQAINAAASAAGQPTNTIDPYAPGGNNAPAGITPPQYTENVSLSPAQQTLLNLQEGNQISGGITAGNVAAQTAQSLNKPITSTPIQTHIDTSGVPGIAGADNLAGFTSQAQDAAYKQATQYLDPQFNQQQEQLDARLRNSGAQPGMPAYDNTMQIFNNQKQQAYSDARDSAVTQGLQEQQALYGESANTNQQKFGEAATTQQQDNAAAQQQLTQELSVRDQPLTEYESLYGLSSPTTGASFGMGGSGGGGAGSLQAPDVMSAFQNQLSAQEANYNAGVSEANTTTATVGSLAAMAAIYF